ncbi:MAG: T9SS type A sorting domain-containing protein [Flavobacteriales bacterium]
MNDQEGFEHVQLVDGRYASIGYVSQGGAGGKDMFLLISDEGGWFMLGQTQGGPDDDFGRSLLRMDGGYLMCGISFSYGAGSSDVFLVRTNEVGFTDSDQVLTNFDPISVQEFAGPVAYKSIYPNPSDGAFTIKADRPITHVRVLDGLGRVAAEAHSTTGDNAFRFDLRSGTYTVVWTDRSGAMTRSPLIIQGP